MSHLATKSDLEAFGNLMQKIGEATAHVERLGERVEAAEARAERCRVALAELVAALDDSADASEHHDDVRAMLRYAAADKAARAALRGEG